MNNLLTIGKIIRHQGNKGEVRVHPLTDFPQRFNQLEKVYLVKDDKIEEKVIEDCWYQNQYIIIKLSGVDDIGKAQELKNYLLKITEDKAVPLLQDEYYLFQLEGMVVKTQSGKFLGKIDNILKTGGVDIFVVIGENKEYMIPASKEIIIDINEDEQIITINPIPGLLEL